MSSHAVVKRLLGESEPSERELSLINILSSAGLDVDYAGPWKLSIDGKEYDVKDFSQYSVIPCVSKSTGKEEGQVYIAIFEDGGAFGVELAYCAGGHCGDVCEEYYYFPSLGSIAAFVDSGSALEGIVPEDGCQFICDEDPIGNIETMIQVSLPEQDIKRFEKEVENLDNWKVTPK